MKAVFDTNILIDYLKGLEAAQVEVSRYREPMISIVTLMELQVGARDEAEEGVIEMFVRDFRVVDLSRQLAREAIDLRRSHRTRLADAIIWATARVESALLVTHNAKDFPADDPGVRIPY